MAYVTGTASDLAGLLTSIQTACTDNGWTLSGSILHKGNAYIRITTSGAELLFRGGTGKDGSNNLTGEGPRDAKFSGVSAQAITYPLTYEVFIFSSPDEVYVVINYASDFYQVAAWGLSDIADLPGTGNFYCALRNTGSNAGFYASAVGVSTNSAFTGMSSFFLSNSDGNGTSNSFIHGDLDGRGWHGTAANGLGLSTSAIEPLYAQLPSAWNDQTVLLPYPVYVPRSTGNKVSIVADLKNIRHCRNTYHDPGDIITLGADQWKIYPWYKKDASVPTGNNLQHSGTIGFALRYDGGT